MAARDANNEGEAPVKSGGGKKRLVIIAAVVLLVLTGGAVAAKFVFFKKKPAQEPPAAHTQNIETLELDSIMVNLADQEESHYLRITVVLTFSGDGKSAKEIKKNEYKIRDQIIQLLRRKSYAEVAAPDYTEKVKAEIMREINRHLPDGRKITDVYLADFLVQ